tara:strand:+ start:352 stop:558 length:207 start_codon:yes stop_codon:yes gene_type:complete
MASKVFPSADYKVPPLVMTTTKWAQKPRYLFATTLGKRVVDSTKKRPFRQRAFFFGKTAVESMNAETN